MSRSAAALDIPDVSFDPDFVPPPAPSAPAIDVEAIRAAQEASARKPDPPPPAPKTMWCKEHVGDVPIFWGGRKGPTPEHPHGSCWFCAVEDYKAALGERYVHPRRRRAQPAPEAVAPPPLQLPDPGQPPMPPDRNGWGA